ncbi:MAG: RsmG family class I SAM-dependent methyltransferase [Acidimicrobiales bacterium]
MTSKAPLEPLLGVLEEARKWGFLGPGPVEDHVAHAARFRRRIERLAAAGLAMSRGLDLGSGGGVPGLVLAAFDDSLHWVLVDAGERRTRFLEDAVAALGFGDRVSVRQGRAEVLARDPDLRYQIDLVVARSFGPPAVTAECATGFLRAGGYLLVSEPPSSELAERWPVDGLMELGMQAEGASEGIQALRQVRLCGDRYPRRVGVPAKRPLFG